MNSDFEIEKCILSLRKKRLIFHSEADFQFALAWEIQYLYPEAKVRLEYCPLEAPNTHIDIMLFYLGNTIPIELKYKTARLALKTSNESFNLKNHGAQDLGKYDCIKDVKRLEMLSNLLMGFSKGYALWLTNESSYWNPPVRSNTVYEAFSIHHTAQKHGIMEWASHASAGTIKGRERPIDLNGTYDIAWKEYSDLEIKNGIFKFTTLMVQKETQADTHW